MNNANDASKRTSSQVRAILKKAGLLATPENLGDGKSFYYPASDLKTRIAIKKAGFLLNRSLPTNKGVSFRTF